jgi:acetyl/propionyl-CoA carboxylase alpha subunit
VSAPERITKLVVANRGEIAIRIFRACRELGIGTVAVVAPDDAGSLHARSADETVAISSYLDAEEHIRAAELTRADAIHPGYGFLAERADFAEAVVAAGVRYVGAPAEALRAGADKLAAKHAAQRAGVPVLPTGEPAEIGYPLVVKARGGGGGRGMRLVRNPDELPEALAAARREAEAAFGDGTVFCERFIERPRHVEVQLLADRHGNVLPLGERDCSVQRRHQKVVEEAPSPAVDPDLRARLGAAAVAFAREIGYVNAGTVEFMLAGRDFYFLELNGRIQVEHPVTELVTGVDIVRAQIEIAAGNRIDAIRPRMSGHAIEARLYAEHPYTFLPQIGRLERLRFPDGVRVDAGVEEGDSIGPAYDPLLAKLIAHGSTRDEARRRLLAALDATEVEGIGTNLPFLRWLLRHPVFRDGEATVAFVHEHAPLSIHPAQPAGAWRGSWRLNLPRPAVLEALTTDGAVRSSAAEGPGTGSAIVTAPMPGKVLRVLVAEGDLVATQQPLVVLSAMKMEMVVTAPSGGMVEKVAVVEQQTVPGGATLLELVDAPDRLPPAA